MPLEGCLTMLRRFMPLLAAGLVLSAAAARAQTATPFPAPLPGQAAGTAPAPGSSPFPPVGPAGPGGFGAPMGAPMGGGPMGGGPPMGGAPAGPPGGDACMKEFLPMREDAEKKAKLIKAASDRHAPPDEACKLIGNFDAAQIKMLTFVVKNSARCGIPPQIADQLKAAHQNVDKMKVMVCRAAEQRKNAGPVAPSLSEALGSVSSAPEINTGKKGGTTFDTLNGNVLAR